MKKTEVSRPVRKREPLLDGLTALVMILCVICTVAPFLYIFAISFSSSAAITNGHVFLWPVEFSTEAYRSVFRYPHFFRAYGYTLLFAFGGTLISLVMTSLLAYPLSKKWLKGQKTVLRMVVFSMFFSGGMIPNYLLVSGLRLTGTVWSILIPFAVNQFYLIILINFFSALPSEIEEAATIDGLGYFGILLRMVIPLSGPALTTIGLYTLVFFWNSWFYPLIYLKSSQYPVMLLLRNIVNGSANAAEGMAQNAALSIAVKSAVILVSSLPILLIYPFFQKYFARGITVGAVKG